MGTIRPRSAVVAGPLVERDRELVEVERAVSELAATGRGGVVMVEGDPGIGKTTILDALRTAAHDAGCDVRHAQGNALETEFAFGVVLQLLAGRLATVAGAERDELLRGAAAAAEPLLEGRPVTGPGSDAFPSLHALTWFVSNAAGRRPMVLCVDDAHAADLPSLRFLRFLALRVADLPVVLAVATRAADGDAERQLTGIRGVARYRLRPARLSRDGVGWVMAGMGYAGADTAFVEACDQTTGGNPFLLRELLLVLADRGVPGTADHAGEVREIGPRAVADAVSLALAGAGPTGEILVRALAVVGDDSAVDVVAAVAGLDLARTLEGVRWLATAGMLADEPRLAFAHPIVQAAIVERTPAYERAHLHQRAAQVLHDRAAHPSVVAAHLLPAEPGAAEWATTVLRDAAARATAVGEPSTAVRYLERARREPGAQRRPELLAELAAAQFASGDPEARATLTTALDVVDDGETQARLANQLGRILLAAGSYRDAVAAFERGIGACPTDAAALEADLRSGWAAAALWLPDEGGEVLARARDAIVSVTAPRGGGERVALAQYAGALLVRGEQRDSAIELALRAWGNGAMLDVLGPHDPAFYAVTAVLADGDRLVEATRVSQTIEDEARRRGLLLNAATAAYVRASALMLSGPLRDASSVIQDALDAESHGWGMFASAAHFVACRVALVRGDREAAIRSVTLDPEHESRLAEGVDFAAIGLARGLLALERGDGATAVAELEAAAARSASFGLCVGCFNWRPPLVRARMLVGDLGGARELAEANVALAERWGAPLTIGAALRALAAVDPVRRLGLLSDARDALVDSGDRVEAVLTALDLGRARAADDRSGALVDYRQALDQADAIDADGLAATARAALVALGARPRRARSTGAAALTPAELRVCRLAADGWTNREIAEHLFVTIKAVKWHLGNAYRKLGIESRSELPAALDA
jgi:DNA-binding CsgD family transcriptional regulator